MSEESKKKPFWKKWWFWVLIVSVLIGGIIEYTEPENSEINTNNMTRIETITEPIEKEELETEENSEIEENTVIESSEAETEDTEEIRDISAYELLTMEGHPVLYDYLSEAHTFWDDYADERIDFGDDVFYNFESGKTVLTIETYLILEHALDEHMIREFCIYPDIEISLEEALNLAKSYLPLDILKKWYALEWSKCYYSEENNTYQYYVLYVPTESGKESIDEQGMDYNYVGVSLTVQDDIVIGLSIVSTNPLGRHTDGKEIDWKFDFLN